MRKTRSKAGPKEQCDKTAQKWALRSSATKPLKISPQTAFRENRSKMGPKGSSTKPLKSAFDRTAQKAMGLNQDKPTKPHGTSGRRARPRVQGRSKFARVVNLVSWQRFPFGLPFRFSLFAFCFSLFAPRRSAPGKHRTQTPNKKNTP